MRGAIMPASVTIAIPTFNRAAYLRSCLTSALAQEGEGVEIVVLDNASTDHTSDVIADFPDPRLRYVRHDHNLGLVGNWQRALAHCRTEYLCLLQDDDELLPGFAHATATALRHHPTASFAYSPASLIDAAGHVTDELDARTRPATGLVAGDDYLHAIVAGMNWAIHISSALVRLDAVRRIGWIDPRHSIHTIDFNLFFRLATVGSVLVLDEPLVRVRYHEAQDHRGRAEALNALPMLAERTDAIAHLLATPRGADGEYRAWLAERLLRLGSQRSAMTGDFVPGLVPEWTQRLDQSRAEIESVVPPDARIVQVDDGSLASDALGRSSVPMTERDGVYWGPPRDAQHAIEELERLRAAGASFLVVAWTAMWWLDSYRGFGEYLASRYRRVSRSSAAEVYDLRAPEPARRRATRKPVRSEQPSVRDGGV
jgi:glycosyltransferase involved in cell wall biosynthesis